LGVRLSIDDYGAGHASLAYVRDLPVDELKIDRAFVSGIDQSSRNAAIVWSTILLCRELGLRVVAEGVETESESEWLIAHDCDLLQGYGIARPMNSDRLLHWLSVQKPVEAG
jgi:EAL domain-containing protein (putative c-di-GMP-specific phosphodiesterase class I)